MKFGADLSVHARAVLLLVVAGCLIAVTIPAYRLLDAERQNVGTVPKEIAATRTWLAPQLAAVAAGVDAHAAAIEGRLDRRLGSIEGRLFDELHQAVNEPEGPLGRAIAKSSDRLQETTGALQTAAGAVATVAGALGPAIEKTGDTVAALRPGFENVSLMALNVREAVAPNLQCKGNGGCWPAKGTAILGGIAKMVGEGGLIEQGWRKETPAIAANIRGITGNGERATRPSKLLTVVKYAAPIVGAVVAGKLASK